MQIKRRDVRDAINFLTFLYGMSVKESTKRFQFIKLLRPETEITALQYKKIGEDYAVKDENGKPKTDPATGDYLFMPHTSITGPEAVKDLLIDEIEIEEKIHKTKLAAVRKIVFEFEHEWKDGEQIHAVYYDLMYDLLDCESLEEKPAPKAKKKKSEEE